MCDFCLRPCGSERKQCISRQNPQGWLFLLCTLSWWCALQQGQQSARHLCSLHQVTGRHRRSRTAQAPSSDVMVRHLSAWQVCRCWPVYTTYTNSLQGPAPLPSHVQNQQSWHKHWHAE